MKHLRLAAWTVWFMLSWVALAHAGPIPAIIGAIGGFLASGTFLANLALTAIFTAAKIGISLLTKAGQDHQQAGVSTDMKFGGDNPLSFIMGDFATPGQLEYANTWGLADEDGRTKNAFLTHVISLGDLPMALTGLWIDDQKVTLPDMSGTPPVDWATGWPIEEYTNSGGTNYQVLLYDDGTQTAANGFLTSTFGSDPDRPWVADMIGRGVPLLIPTARFNRQLHNGIPQYLAETSGIALYDPREDTSVGGVGDQRWNDPATWMPSSNPVVQVYNILRGIHYAGEWIWGGRCEAWQLPVASWMAMMNVCDQTITNADGSTEKQFRSGLEITTDREPADVIENILKGCNGRIAEMGGTYKVLVGAPGAAVYSFTDETIVVTEGQSLDPFPGLESTFNGAQASYPEPAEKWAAKDAPAYLRADLESLDDDRRLVTGLQYPTVPYALQVQRLLQTAVQDARRFRVHQIVLPPEAWLLEPNDVVSWTSTWNGYEEKKFLITEIEGDSNFTQYATLKEIDPADYSWDAATDEQPYSIGFIGTIVPPPQAMTGFQAFPTTFSSGGKDIPTIGIAFAGALDDVRAVRVQVRLAATGVLVFDGELPYGEPDPANDPRQVVLNATFLAETDHEVRAVLVPFSGRETSWSGWLAVTTDAGGYGIFPAGLEDLADDVKELQAFTGQKARELADEILRLSAVAANVGATGAAQAEQLRRDVKTTKDNITSSYQELITTQISVVNGQVSALSAQYEQLQVQVNDDIATSIAAVQVQIDDLGDEVAANIDTINDIDIKVDGVTAGATFRMNSYVAPAGYGSRIGAEARVSVNDVYTSAAWYLDAKADGTARMVIVADFVVTDGTHTARPLYFDAATGALYSDSIKARTVNFEDGSITSSKIGPLQVTRLAV